MGYLGKGPGIRRVLLIKHQIGGLSYVRALFMSNPPRIYSIHLSPARQGGEPYAGVPRGREHPLGQGRGESPAREAPVSSRAEGRGSARLYRLVIFDPLCPPLPPGGRRFWGGEHDSCKIPDSTPNVLKLVELSRLSHLDFRSGFGAVFQGVLWVFTLSRN